MKLYYPGDRRHKVQLLLIPRTVPYLYMVYISYGIISLYTGTILICVITIH